MQKNKTLAFLAAVGMFVVLAATLCAQPAPFIGDIPFEFVVGGKTMPAGEYTVRTALGSGSALVIAGLVAGHQERAAFLTNSSSVVPGFREKPELVFNRYGNQYFLSQILIGGGRQRGWSFPKSRAERGLAKQAAANPSETLTVLAKR